MPVKPSIGLWYQTINPKSVRIGPCQFNNDWLKQEKIIGIDPEIKAIAQFDTSPCYVIENAILVGAHDMPGQVL